jgi:hypothetical protein
MCLACDMEEMWFAMMDARTRAAAGETVPQSEEQATLLPLPQSDEALALLPPPERGRVGEGVAGGTDEAASMSEDSQDPHPNPPPEGGGGSSARQRTNPPRRFACEETSAE